MHFAKRLKDLYSPRLIPGPVQIHPASGVLDVGEST